MTYSHDDDATERNTVSRQQRRRDRARIEPQRTGPDRLNLASLDDAHKRLGISYPEPTADFTIDLHSIAHLGLSLLERNAVLSHIRDGINAYEIHRALGCTRSEAVAALNRGLRKLASSPESIAFTPLTNSLRLTYKERFASGPPLWALSKLDRGFLQIMAAEKKYYVQGQRLAPNSRRVLPVSTENPTMATITIQKLKKAVHDAERNHERVCEHLDQVRTARDQADRKLENALFEFQREQALAIHENRPPDISLLTKQLAALRTEIAAHENALAAAKGARDLSEAAVAAAKGSMESNRRAAAIAAISDLCDEYLEGQTLQSERLGKIHGIAGAHGYGVGLIVPPDINILDYAERVHWQTRCSIINADLALHTARARERWPELKTASAKE